MRPKWRSRLLVAFLFTTTWGVAQDHVSGRMAPVGGKPLHDSIVVGPGALAVDNSGNVYAAARNDVFRIDSSGTHSRLAISSPINPHAIALDAAGNVYFADSGHNRVGKVDMATRVVTIVAGSGVKGFSGNGGQAASATLDGPTGLATTRQATFSSPMARQTATCVFAGLRLQRASLRQ